jgi:electron transfer flavoprotein beta subunit
VNVTVLVKHVPNVSGVAPEIGPDHRLRRAVGDGGLDPGDEPGVAIALGVTAATGGEITALTMGPERAASSLRRALALGAHRATLVSDEALAGADALGTARVLAAAIARRPADLVIAGVESADGGTGTVPMTVAELLGVASVTFVTRLVVADGRLRAERQTEDGRSVVECGLPALVTVTGTSAQPRTPSLREILAAKKEPVERLSLRDLDIDPRSVVATQHVTSVELAEERQGGEVVEADGATAARIVRFLREAGVA